MANYQRGSEWRRWDLHLHTASSYDYDYNADDADELLVNALAENDIAAVAITDHFTIDKNRIEHLRLLAPNIVFFPGVELRTDKGGANIHVILIFSDICNLQTLSDDFDAIMLRNKAKSAEDNNKVYWDFNDITDFAKSHDALISLHTGKKTNGLDKEITNAIEVGQAIKKEYSDNADIFEIGKISDITDYKSIVFPQIKEEKPLILCSDNHDPRSYSAKSKLWIKADVTFNGLKQIVFEPSERVCVSDTKPEQKSSYQVIESVKFVNNDSFQEEAIVFNQNLNCIIGGKSTGKSLLLHNMAMSIDPEQTTAKTDYINDADRTKSRKSKFPAPQVTVNWLDSNDSNERKIVYIPQKYLNRLADDEESTTAIDDLIEKIVLSKTDGDGQKLDTTQRSMQAQIDAILSNGAKGLIDISRYYSDVQAYNSKIKELGGELLVKQEIERLKAEIQDLSIKINLDEKDFLRYDEILRKLADKEKTVQNLTKDIRLIQELDAVFHINEIGLNDEETLKTVATFLSDIESKANQLWIEERDKILQGIHARIALTNTEIEKLSAEKELLRPRIEGNNELSTKNKQLATEQEKLSAIDGFATQANQLNETLKRLIDEVAQGYTGGIKSSSELYAQYINNNTSTISTDLSFEVQVRMKNDEFIERWQEVYGIKSKNVNDFLGKWVSGSDNDKVVNYDVNLINEIIQKTLSGTLVPLKNRTAQEAFTMILSNWFTIKYVVKMGDDTIDLMSPGKKALVLLKLLIELADSTCPILIDQPEDDLDNRSIYDQLIGFIKSKKTVRQIIVVTHNANIVVGADAEEVIIANQDGKDSQNKVKKFEYRSGSIENDIPVFKADGTCEPGILNKQGIQQHICAILEGGEEAFEKRKEKYHI